MRRLLVLSCLAVAVITIPALASAGNPASPSNSIGSTVSDATGDRAADYWTAARMAAATDLSVLVLPDKAAPAQS